MLNNTAKTIAICAIMGAATAINLLSNYDGAFVIGVIASVILFCHEPDEDECKCSCDK